MDAVPNAVEPDVDDDLDMDDEPVAEQRDPLAQYGPTFTNKSQRLEILIGFISLYSPGATSLDDGDVPSTQQIDPVESIDDEDVSSARNLALIAAYGAIRRIAMET